MKVGVIYGGKSLEHDVSIITALQVMSNLDTNKYKVIPLYLTHENELLSFKKLRKIDIYSKNLARKPRYTIVSHKGVHSLMCLNRKFKNKQKIDLIFNCTHGFNTEDGTVASWLNLLGIPNTSPKILSSTISQDKEYTKIIMKGIGVKVLEYISINDSNLEKINELTKDLNYPLIIKPAHLCSSIGIQKVYNKDELNDKVKQSLMYDDKIIIEKYLKNFKEYSVAVYKRKNEIYISEIEEINTDNKIFDYEEKYINHHKENEHTFLKEKNLINQIKEYSKKAYLKLELTGIVRFDFLKDDNDLYLNEINTIPGGMANYLFKKQISFKLLLDEQIRETMFLFQQNKKYINIYKSSILNNKEIKFKK